MSKQFDSQHTENELNPHQDGVKKFSTGVYILSIFFIVLGGFFVYDSLIKSRLSVILGVLYLISGIGMLKRKYWALRFSQVFLILGLMLGVYRLIIAMIGMSGSSGMLDFIIVMFPLALFLLVLYILPIWFLFKKSTVNQFKRKSRYNA